MRLKYFRDRLFFLGNVVAFVANWGVVPPSRSGMVGSAVKTTRELGGVFGVAALAPSHRHEPPRIARASTSVYSPFLADSRGEH